MTKKRAVPKYEFRWIDGVVRNARRGVVFAWSAADRFVDIVPLWDALEPPVKRYFKASMDIWLRGQRNSYRFHGWNREGANDYRGCFVFRKTGKRFAKRIYGFLCNPSTEVPNFQLCVLAHGLEEKRVRETDKSILEKLLNLRRDCSPAILFTKLLMNESEGRDQ
jgi:hypothetical protein